MDYGHTNQDREQDFFTVGAGTNNPNRNDVNPEDNLDTDNHTWDITPIRNPQNLGNSAIFSADMPNFSNQSTENTPRMGEVIDMNMPPEPDQANHSEQTPSTTADIIDFSSIAAKNDSISKEAFDATRHAVSEFEKGKITPAELDDLRWNSTRSYLKNSFGRELAA